ncbi:MAG: pyruvate decarboxylase [Betaproteobacteria bacterium]|nr:pyruvate decarboxylase [Betaproteobacteria bacterium]
MSNIKQVTVGSYLGLRLVQAGLRDFFTVPGDFTLVLLDQLLATPGLRMISCCNELNAGYAADGYARTSGFSAAVVTYTVGGLSLINAVAGAYGDDLSLLAISGGPNSNDARDHHRIHHTIGELDLYQAERCYAPVVAAVFNIRHLEDAAKMIDEAIVTCLTKKKPVYLEIACNLTGLSIPAPTPMQFPLPAFKSDPNALAAAVDAATKRINAAVKPAVVVGEKIRPAQSADAVLGLVNAMACAIATTPDAKGIFPEDHPNFLGTYWSEVSSPNCSEIIESSDCQLLVGVQQTDYTTTGWTALYKMESAINIGIDQVSMPEGVFSKVYMSDFLDALASKVSKKEASMQEFRRYKEPIAPVPVAVTTDVLNLRELRRQIQGMINSETSLLVDTGDSWFNGQDMHLPKGASYHVQMQYGSIGWSVGATLGVALASKPDTRVIALIGDGSFQMTAQELSTMIRYQVNPIIFLMNNGGYTIEVELHDGPYNQIKNWDYAGLINVFNAGDGKGLGIKVKTAGDLSVAISQAIAHTGGPVLIECPLDRDDCSKQLAEWGSHVAKANARV